MEVEKKSCSCEKMRQLAKKNSDLKKQVAELVGKIDKLEKFIKGGKV